VIPTPLWRPSTAEREINTILQHCRRSRGGNRRGTPETVRGKLARRAAAHVSLAHAARPAQRMCQAGSGAERGDTESENNGRGAKRRPTAGRRTWRHPRTVAYCVAPRHDVLRMHIPLPSTELHPCVERGRKHSPKVAVVFAHGRPTIALSRQPGPRLRSKERSGCVPYKTEWPITAASDFVRRTYSRLDDALLRTTHERCPYG
jgi:hypothetical protein